MIAPQRSLLEVDSLTVSYGRKARTRALDDVDLKVDRGEVVALVGQSGSGKSTLGRAVIGLGGHQCVAEGKVRFDGEDISALSEREWSKVRGSKMSMIFQDPQASLTPTLTIGRQVAEAAVLARSISRSRAEVEAIEMLGHAGLDNPRHTAKSYPHELSGGMCQRAMIALALINKPLLLIADEPTSALDVTVQSKVLETLTELVSEFGVAMLFISHDLGVVAGISDRVVVLDKGKVVDSGPTKETFLRPSSDVTNSMVAAALAREACLVEVGDHRG